MRRAIRLGVGAPCLLSWMTCPSWPEPYGSVKIEWVAEGEGSA